MNKRFRDRLATLADDVAPPAADLGRLERLTRRRRFRRRAGAALVLPVIVLAVVVPLAGLMRLGDSDMGRSVPGSAEPHVDGTAEEPTTDHLVGKEYAESLGLPIIAKPSDCHYAAEAPPDEVVYCLDKVADNDVEARLIGWRITGHIPSEEEAQLAELFSQEDALLRDKPVDEDQLLEIRNQIADLVEQINLQKDAG